jgi:hypothetical protein
MRINTHLQVSRTKTWVHALLFLLVFLILVFSEMPVVVIALALTAMICMLAYQRFFQKASPHLVQLVQFDKQAWRWSVFDPNRIKKSIQQEGQLLSVHHWFFVLVMRFETFEKNKKVTQNWVIWRDQVDVNHWRRLIVIARFWASDTQNSTR